MSARSDYYESGQRTVRCPFCGTGLDVMNEVEVRASGDYVQFSFELTEDGMAHCLEHTYTGSET